MDNTDERRISLASQQKPKRPDDAAKNRYGLAFIINAMTKLFNLDFITQEYFSSIGDDNFKAIIVADNSICLRLRNCSGRPICICFHGDFISFEEYKPGAECATVEELLNYQNFIVLNYESPVDMFTAATTIIGLPKGIIKIKTDSIHGSTPLHRAL